uniref:Uncharacterized protein n=1 Tax=Nelumbo nucifera TaxID=4432 RepID=A0A822YZR6_NELNU|nr:TPA_asm: hypothetical protein HUJ06_005338 [Nelumbo nucifera]
MIYSHEQCEQILFIRNSHERYLHLP